MIYLLTVSFIAIFVSMSYSDVMIDDFEDGKSRNLLNGEWYYFTDEKDGGNSVIVNAEKTSAGNYSQFKPEKGGYNSSYCAKMDYVLGDVSPEASWSYCNFAAIGTDIARTGDVADISFAYGISFSARSLDTVIIFFELVTSNIYDYAYHRAYFRVTDKWQAFQVDFNDSNQFTIPMNSGSYDIDDHPLILSKVQKINWQIAACFEDIDSCPPFNSDEIRQYVPSENGFLCLDNIILLDSTKVAVDYIPVKSKRKKDCINSINDLLGRRVSVSDYLKKIPGLYLLPEKKKTNIHLLHW